MNFIAAFLTVSNMLSHDMHDSPRHSSNADLHLPIRPSLPAGVNAITVVVQVYCNTKALVS